MSTDRYAPEPSTKKLAEAIKWSKSHTEDGRVASTRANDDAEARRRYSDNYESIFGKRDIPHGV